MTRRAALRSVIAALLLLPGFQPFLRAAEKKDASPAITAIAPLEITPGTAATLRIRGLRLDTASEVRFAGPITGLAAQIKERKKAEVPNGLEAGSVGDTEVAVSLTVPADLPTGSVSFTVVTPDGATAPHELRVLPASALVEEKEPNNGFRNAQLLAIGKTLRGTIGEDKDVDVFQFSGGNGQHLLAEVRAARLGSLLDAVLTLYDAHGHILATCDDAAGSRDPQLDITLPGEGQYFLAVQDASDRGGPWHAYELEIKEVPN